MLSFIDSLLNKITMYRLVLYYLIFLLLVAALFGAVGILPYSPLAIAASTAILTAAAWLTNLIFAKIWKAHPNVESVYITALILALIITPVLPASGTFVSFLVWAAVWSMASKYILAIDKKHIFNPAAFAVALTAVTIHQYAGWWIGGNLPMAAFVILGGLLVTRKLRRFDLVIPFFAAAAVSILVASGSGDIPATLQKAALHTPIFFFAFIMLTEPLTTPPTRGLRIIYAVLVGALYAPQVHLLNIYSTPELALLAGNIFSYFVSPKKKYMLALSEKKGIGTGIYDFVFKTDAPVHFTPGQYMEWTLHHKRPDTRGNRRYFTIASSPTEKNLRLGVRFYERGSSFKKAMLKLSPGDTVMGGQLAGDFTLPRDPQKKLAFIAGGIGITPFRSMVKYLSDKHEQRDIVLLYSNRTADEISYRDVFDEARGTLGLRTIYAVSDGDITNKMGTALGKEIYKGKMDAALVRREVPDYRERMFYISGSHAMVEAFQKMLIEMGVRRNNIKTDFFPGFA